MSQPTTMLPCTTCTLSSAWATANFQQCPVGEKHHVTLLLHYCNRGCRIYHRVVALGLDNRGRWAHLKIKLHRGNRPSEERAVHL